MSGPIGPLGPPDFDRCGNTLRNLAPEPLVLAVRISRKELLGSSFDYYIVCVSTFFYRAWAHMIQLPL